MRIGLFSDTFPPEINGVANSTRILADSLKKRGHDVFVVCTHKALIESELSEDGRILRLAGMELKFLYGYVMTSPFHMKAMEQIKAMDLDIIHVQTEFGVGIFARLCAKHLGLPIVSTYHTTYEDYTHYVNFLHSETVDHLAKKGVASLSRMYGNSTIEVIAPSQKTKELLESYHISRRISVIPTGLELERFSPLAGTPEKREEIRKEYGFSTDDVLVVYVGRLAQEKSMDIVIRGFANAVKQGMNVKLLITGGGPDLEPLKKLTEQLGICDTVKFSGPKPAEEVPDIYRAADAFISASRSETQGMTFIEALASGLPLFARHDEVLEELLIDGKTGWYFEDEDDLPDQLRKLTGREEETVRKMRDDCVAHASGYSCEQFAESVEAVYRRAVKAYRDRWLVDDIEYRQNYAELTLYSNEMKKAVVRVTTDEFYELSIHKGDKLLPSVVDELFAHETGLSAYQKSLHRISVKDRTVKEIRDWLEKETKCTPEQVEAVLKRLLEQGYLDDERYCREKTASMRRSAHGTAAIMRDLKERGIPEEMINEMIGTDEDSREYALHYAQRKLNANANDSVTMVRRKIVTSLMQRGYSASFAESIVEELDFSERETEEENNLDTCVRKAYVRYSKRYSGRELQERVFRWCMTKGFRSDDIKAALERIMENEEDQGTEGK